MTKEKREKLLKEKKINDKWKKRKMIKEKLTDLKEEENGRRMT